MSSRIWSVVAVMLIIIVAAVPAFAQEQKNGEKVPAPMASSPDYIISAGDILDISVWKDEALTRIVTVLPDGKIHFPLVGDFTAAGKTVGQLREEMKAKINRYVPDAILSIDVKQVNSLLIYVIGRVNAPGRFLLNTNVNVLQALSMAGGLNPFAKRNNIKIFRDQGGTTKILYFHYDDVIEGKRLEENILLNKGDVIVVP